MTQFLRRITPFIAAGPFCWVRGLLCLSCSLLLFFPTDVCGSLLVILSGGVLGVSLLGIANVFFSGGLLWVFVLVIANVLSGGLDCVSPGYYYSSFRWTWGGRGCTLVSAIDTV